VFKTSTPPVSGGKLMIGNECGNVSTTTGHVSNLIFLGDMLEQAGKSNYELTTDAIYKTRKITNSSNLCLLINLTLRLMDYYEINQNRWFFRPVSARYFGHKGILRSGRK
jgi:hypothetical protein